MARHKGLLLLILLFFPCTVFAQQPSTSATEKISIGGKEYAREQIYADFLALAFSNKLWWEEYAKKDGNREEWESLYSKSVKEKNSPKSTFSYFQGISSYVFPWFENYLLQDPASIKLESLHRWDKKITIGIDWPAYRRGSQASNAGRGKGSVVYTRMASIIKKDIESIKSNTGIDIELMMPNDPREISEEYARIRIVPEKYSWSSGDVQIRERNQAYVYDLEKWLWTALAFPSNDRDKYDGYLLSNADNQVGLVICKLNLNLSDAELENHVNECIIRSLGLPGEIIKGNNWVNTFFGKGRFIPQQDAPYNYAMLKLLYCPLLKVGMSRSEVSEILNASDACLNSN